METDFNPQQPYNINPVLTTLTGAIQRAQTLYPTEDPMTHIFLSVRRDGSPRFEAKERGLGRLRQRFYIRSLTTQKIQNINLFLTNAPINKADANAMHQITHAYEQILAHVESKRQDTNRIRKQGFTHEAQTLPDSIQRKITNTALQASLPNPLMLKSGVLVAMQRTRRPLAMYPLRPPIKGAKIKTDTCYTNKLICSHRALRIFIVVGPFLS